MTDSAVRLVQPQNATITVDVVPAPVERELAGVPIRWRNLQAGLSATDTGPESAPDKLESVSAHATGAADHR